MRSITRSYFGGSSYLTPSSLIYSATTSPRPRSLIPLISASGNVFSRPTRTPTRFIYVLSVLSRKPRKIPAPVVLVKQASGASPLCIHATSLRSKATFLQGLCYNSASKLAFPSRRRRIYGDQFQGERSHFASSIRRP